MSSDWNDSLNLFYEMQHGVARTKQWQPNIRWNWHSPSPQELIWTLLAMFRAHTDNWKRQLKTPRTLFGPQKNYFQIKWNSHQDHQQVPPQKHRVPSSTSSNAVTNDIHDGKRKLAKHPEISQERRKKTGQDKSYFHCGCLDHWTRNCNKMPKNENPSPEFI